MKNINYFGIYSEYLPVNLFNLLKEQIQNLKGKISFQGKLAGNIKEEWNISESIPLFNEYILSLMNKNQSHVDFLNLERKKFINNNNTPAIGISDLWVNFQKKHEFNPVHDHSGLFSFVIFIQIPYDIDRELKEGPGSSSNTNLSSCLQFQATNTTGRIHTESVFVDKSYEGGIYFFNAETKHCVYPFFTSDDYRITVSGNVKWIY